MQNTPRHVGIQKPITVQSGLTPKSLLLAFVLIPFNIWWLIELEVVRVGYPTIIHPQANVIFIVFWLLLIGYALHKLSPRLGISQQELLTVHFMLCIVSCLCSWDMLQILMPIMSYPFRFATPENDWRNLFWRNIPEWLTVSDEKTLLGYYEGGSSLYTLHYLKAWLAPVIAWSSFIFVLMVVLLCINTLLRIQWTEHERLSYPLTQLPLEMTNPRLRFFRNRLMWIGFSIAALISIVNLLNSIYPIIPYIPVKRQGIGGGIRVSFYPFVIGMSFMMPQDLLFSCWAFYWLYKIELMIGDMMGWRNLPRFPYAAEQGFGVYMGLLIFALWIGRSHFIGLLRHLFTSSRSRFQLDDSREPMPYRLAVIGIVFGIIVLDGVFLQSRYVVVGDTYFLWDLFLIIDYDYPVACGVGVHRPRTRLSSGHRSAHHDCYWVRHLAAKYQHPHRFFDVHIFQSCLLGQSDAGTLGSLQDVGKAEYQPASYGDCHSACNSDRIGCEFLVFIGQLLPTWA